MNGKACRSVVHYNNVFDVSPLKELNKILNLEFSVWVRCAILSRNHIIEIFLIFLNGSDNGFCIDVEPSCEKDKLKMLFKLGQHFEKIWTK